MPGRLTPHVLDTARGRPAAGVPVRLARLDADGSATILVETRTNADGRTDAPLVPTGELEAGSYELVFAVGAYFAARGVAAGGPPFPDEVPLRFRGSDPAAHHHVPLIVTPWSYSAYRGS